MSEEARTKYVALFIINDTTSSSPGETGGLQQNRSFKFFDSLAEAMSWCEQVCASGKYAVTSVVIMGSGGVNVSITGIDADKRYIWAGQGLPPKEAEGG